MNNNDKLKGLISNNVSSKWELNASYRLKNKKWLRYSSNIARRVFALMEDSDNMNQKELAAKLNATPQYVSKILKGDTNLTLETIALLSDVLGGELISFPSYKYSVMVNQKNNTLTVVKGYNATVVKTEPIISENNVEPVIIDFDYEAA